MPETAATQPCTHTPYCPTADSPDGEAAQTVVRHPEQGWSLLCNGLIHFEDTGELLPDGRIVAPHRPTDTLALQNLVGVQLASRSLRLADTKALIGGTSGGGKTSAAAMHKFALAAERDRADVPADHPSV